jgi:hypothetical protein
MSVKFYIFIFSILFSFHPVILANTPISFSIKFGPSILFERDYFEKYKPGFSAGIIPQIELTKVLDFEIGILYNYNARKSTYDFDSTSITTGISGCSCGLYWSKTTFSSVNIPIALNYKLFNKSKWNLSVLIGSELWFPLLNKIERSEYRLNRNGYVDHGPFHSSYAYTKDSNRSFFDWFQLSGGVEISKTISHRLILSSRINYTRFKYYNYWKLLLGLKYTLN